MRFFRPNPDSVSESRPFGRETESVRAFLDAFSASPGETAPRLIAAAAGSGWDAAERDDLITRTLRDARTNGRLSEAAAVMRATEVAADRSALNAIAVLVNPAAATAIEAFLKKIGQVETQRLRTLTLASYVSGGRDEYTPRDKSIEQLMAYFVVLDYLLFQAAASIGLRPYMPPGRSAALWFPFAASFDSRG